MEFVKTTTTTDNAEYALGGSDLREVVDFQIW